MVPRILFQLMDTLFSLIHNLFKDRADLAMENLALRQQLAVLHRKHPRPRLDDFDRAFWAALKDRFSAWSDALIIVKPETVVAWHRAAFRRHWTRLSRAGRPPGRPRISRQVRDLIHRMAIENRWGAPRIHAELLKLGIDVSEATVSRYMPRRSSDPDVVARWRAFLRSHLPEIAAMDFVTIPTATFRVLYGFFVIHHDRRRVLHFNVTANPTAAWVRQQLREAFLDNPRIHYLIHDRDTKFSGIAEWLKTAGAESILTGYRSPWQNGICERFLLTLRSELLDHVIVLNEAHARRLIAGFLAYYHEDRCHLALDKDSPDPRPVQQRPSRKASVIAIPRAGGLHHRYEWRDAA